MANPFKSKVNQKNFSRPEGAGNFDNMDDHNVVKTTSLLQGNIQHTPTLAKDIVNKEYVDPFVTNHPHQDVNTTASPTFAELDVDTLNLNGNTITDSTGDIDFDDENLKTEGNLEVGKLGTTKTFKLFTAGGASRFTLQTADSLGIFSVVKNTDAEWGFGMLSTESFIIRDIESGNINVFRANQGAPIYSIYIDSGGDMGFGREPQSGNRFQIVTPGTLADLYIMKANGDILLPNDDQFISWGATETDLKISSDGTNGVIETAAALELKTGDVFFSGSGSGLCYGGFYGNEIGHSQAMTQNTTYTVTDTDITDTPTNNITGDGQGKITITKAGVYKIDWAVTAQHSATGKHILWGITKDGTLDVCGRQHRETKATDQEYQISGTCIITLAVNEYIEIGLLSADATPGTASVSHINLTAIQVGG